MKICKIEGCGRKHKGRGLCANHYTMFRYYNITGEKQRQSNYKKKRYANDPIIREKQRIRSSNNYYSNKENIIKRSKEYHEKQRRENPLLSLIKNAKYRAKRKELEFNININDLTSPLYCPVLGILLNYISNKPADPNSATIDRIDNSKGYIGGNVHVISFRANSLKKDATVDEMEKILKYMKDNYNDKR